MVDSEIYDYFCNKENEKLRIQNEDQTIRISPIQCYIDDGLNTVENMILYLNIRKKSKLLEDTAIICKHISHVQYIIHLLKKTELSFEIGNKQNTNVNIYLDDNTTKSCNHFRLILYETDNFDMNKRKLNWVIFESNYDQFNVFN